MDGKNMSKITTIHLLGFQTPQNKKYSFFFMFLLIYCMSVCGNLLIIALVSYSKILHSPMYFFLTQLAVSDILLITDVLPNMFHAVVMENDIISFSNCISQLYFFGVAETLECLLLTVMSFDRYLAICKPLYYNSIMNHQFCWMMIITCWTLSVVTTCINTVTVSQLDFCGPNIIDFFFCDLDPLLNLSCSETTIVQIVMKLAIAVVVVIPFCIVFVSYICIIVSVLAISSVNGKKKAFSTCSSHLTVVSSYYGTLFGVYLVPRRGNSQNIGKFLSLLYTVVTPLMNPIIYCLRNKDVKNAVEKVINYASNSMQMRHCH